MAQKLETRCEKKHFILFKIQIKKKLILPKIAFKKNLYFQKSPLGGLHVTKFFEHAWQISGVRSAMRAASQLPGRGPTVVDMAPILAR